MWPGGAEFHSVQGYLSWAGWGGDALEMSSAQFFTKHTRPLLELQGEVLLPSQVTQQSVPIVVKMHQKVGQSSWALIQGIDCHRETVASLGGGWSLEDLFVEKVRVVDSSEHDRNEVGHAEDTKEVRRQVMLANFALEHEKELIVTRQVSKTFLFGFSWTWRPAPTVNVDGDVVL